MDGERQRLDWLIGVMENIPRTRSGMLLRDGGVSVSIEIKFKVERRI